MEHYLNYPEKFSWFRFIVSQQYFSHLEMLPLNLWDFSDLVGLELGILQPSQYCLGHDRTVS